MQNITGGEATQKRERSYNFDQVMHVKFLYIACSLKASFCSSQWQLTSHGHYHCMDVQGQNFKIIRKISEIDFGDRRNGINHLSLSQKLHMSKLNYLCTPVRIFTWIGHFIHDIYYSSVWCNRKQWAKYIIFALFCIKHTPAQTFHIKQNLYFPFFLDISQIKRI